MKLTGEIGDLNGIPVMENTILPWDSILHMPAQDHVFGREMIWVGELGHLRWVLELAAQRQRARRDYALQVSTFETMLRMNGWIS